MTNKYKGEDVSDQILVAYATRNGSTQGVAEVVTEALRESGVDVDLQPMRDVSTLAGYSAVVLGAPLYMMRWHKDAMTFLRRHRADLSDIPVAVFALGPFHDEPSEFEEVRRELDKELAKLPWLAPIAIEIVGGKHDPDKLNFPWNLIPAMRQMPASDIRDWAAIRMWTKSIAAELQPAVV
jgi:menaquinone-dependent protoporphyrinogen oxidase